LRVSQWAGESTFEAGQRLHQFRDLEGSITSAAADLLEPPRPTTRNTATKELAPGDLKLSDRARLIASSRPQHDSHDGRRK
jgi:hypothetical protein